MKYIDKKMDNHNVKITKAYCLIGLLVPKVTGKGLVGLKPLFYIYRYSLKFCNRYVDSRFLSYFPCRVSSKIMAPERDIMVKNKWSLASLIFISAHLPQCLPFPFGFFYQKNCLGPFFLNLPCSLASLLPDPFLLFIHIWNNDST